MVGGRQGRGRRRDDQSEMSRLCFPAAQIAVTAGVGTVSFSQCHFDAWDKHVSPDGKSFVSNGTAAITQVSEPLPTRSAHSRLVRRPPLLLSTTSVSYSF